MGQKPWTTNEQANWLKERKKAFVDAQVNKTTRAFFNSTTKAFVQKWPVGEPTVEEIAEEGGLEEAQNARQVAQRTVSTHARSVCRRKLTHLQQIKYWFRNHTRMQSGTKATKVSTATLLLTHKKVQMMFLYQAYMHLHRAHIMPLIKEAYIKYCGAYGEGKMPSHWFPWTCEEATCLLEKESDDVKQVVEAYRQAHYQEQTPTELAIEDIMKDGPEEATKRVKALQT